MLFQGLCYLTLKLKGKTCAHVKAGRQLAGQTDRYTATTQSQINTIENSHQQTLVEQAQWHNKTLVSKTNHND